MIPQTTPLYARRAENDDPESPALVPQTYLVVGWLDIGKDFLSPVIVELGKTGHGAATLAAKGHGSRAKWIYFTEDPRR